MRLCMSLWMLSATPGYCQESEKPHTRLRGYKTGQTEPGLARYLDLQGNFATIVQHPVMHLTDRGSSERLFVKRREFLSPAGPQILLQDFLPLGFRHTHTCLKARLGISESTDANCQVTDGVTRSRPTFICQLGMKSALWRTRSKTLCSWG